MTKEDFLAIKVGDQWLDSSGTFIGTCTIRTETGIQWCWHKTGSEEVYVESGMQDLHHLANNAQRIEWKMLTPLLKELL